MSAQNQDILDAIAKLSGELVELKSTQISPDLSGLSDAVNRAIDDRLPDGLAESPTMAAKGVSAMTAAFDPERPDVTLADMLTQPCDDDRVNEFKHLNDLVYPLQTLAMATNQVSKLESMREWRNFRKLGREVMGKALSTTGSGTGDELMSEGFSNVIVQPRGGLRVADLFPALFLTDETYRWPSVGQIAPAYLATEPTTDTADNIPTRTPSTYRATFTPKTLAVRVPFSYQFDLLSLGPATGWINEQISYALRDAIGDAVLNGDTAATHQDAAVTTANDRRKAWEGLRQLAQAPSTDRTADIDGFAEGDIATLKLLLAPEIYGEVEANELAFLTSPRTKAKMIGDTTNWPNFQSIDKAGGRAANVSGSAISQVYGHSVISSHRISNTHSSAVADDGNGTDSVVYMVYPAAYRLAYWRQVTLEAVRDPKAAQIHLVGHVICDFQPLFDAASIYAVSLGYDVP